jgi:hypothetical protein
LSTNPHVANVLYFGRVKVNGKSIRHAFGPGCSGRRRPCVINELAPDAGTSTMCSLGTQRNASSATACAEGWSCQICNQRRAPSPARGSGFKSAPPGKIRLTPGTQTFGLTVAVSVTPKDCAPDGCFSPSRVDFSRAP